MQQILIPFFIIIYGLVVGSFLNVCIYRIPLDKSVAKGRSYCPNCGELIPWQRNIPLISFIILKGRCKDCHTSISIIYPLVEFLNALLWLITWLMLGFTLEALFIALLSSLLIVVSFIDLKHKIIPDGLVIILLILGFSNACFQIFFNNQHWSLWIIGFFAASLPLYLMGMIYRDGMGGGDIKFMAAAGLFLGWKLILLALFIGSIYALLYALVLLISRKAIRKTQIPFGPFLSLGIITSAFVGSDIINLYLTLFF